MLYTFFVVSNTTATKRTSRRAADGPDGSAQVRCDLRPPQQPPTSQGSSPEQASCHVPARCPGSAEPMATSQLLVAGCGCQGLNTTDSRQAGLLGLELAGDEVRVSAQPAESPPLILVILTRHSLTDSLQSAPPSFSFTLLALQATNWIDTTHQPAPACRLQCRRAVVYTTTGCLAHHAGRRKRSCCVVYGRSQETLGSCW